MDRLQAIQDRIWAISDALLTIRLPLEKFYHSLADEQHGRLRRDASEGTVGMSDGRSQNCGEQTAAIADPAGRAIERALRPTEQQLATFKTLQMRSAGMAQLIASTCPTEPLVDDMGRFAAATDRVATMLFAAMSIGPALQEFYDSLSDKQKGSLSQAIHALRRAGLWARCQTAGSGAW